MTASVINGFLVPPEAEEAPWNLPGPARRRSELLPLDSPDNATSFFSLEDDAAANFSLPRAANEAEDAGRRWRASSPVVRYGDMSEGRARRARHS